MGFKDILELVITGDARGATTALEKTGATAERELGKTNDHLGRLGGKMQLVGAGMVGFGALALGALGHFAHAAEEAEIADLKLNNSIAHSPKLAGESADAFNDLATSLMQTTIYDDEATKSMMAYLIQTGRTKDETLRLTPAIQDLASKMGIDLDSAAKSVTLALNGKKKGLEAMLGPLDAATYKTDRMAAVMDGLARVQGFAAEQGKTFDGQLTILQNNLGELAEGVGVGVLDAFTKMFGAIENVTGALDSLSPGAQSAIGEWATYGATALIALGAMNMIVGTLIKSAGFLGIHAAAEVTDTVAVEANTVALEANAGASYAVAGAWAAVAIGAAALTFKAVTDTVDEFSFSLHGAVPTLAEWQSMLPTLRTSLDATGLSMYDFGHQIAAESIPAAQNLVEALGATTPEAMEVQRAITDLGHASNEAKAKTEGLTVAQYEAKQTAEQYAASIKEVRDQLHASVDPMFAMEKAVLDNQQAQADLTAKQHDGKTSAAELQGENIRVAQSAMAVHDAAIALTAAVHDGTTSVEDATATLQGFVDQGLISQTTMDELTYAMGGVVGQADQLFAYDGRTVDIGVNVHTNGMVNISELGAIANREFHGAAGLIGTVTQPTRLVVGEGGEPEDVMVIPHSKGGIGGMNASSGVTFAPVINVSTMDARGVDLAVLEALHSAVRTYDVPEAIRNAFAA